MKVKSLLFAVLCLVISFSYGQDFEVSPVVLNFSLEPGEVASKTITITNYSAKEYTFVLEQYDEGYNGEEIERYMPPGTSYANMLKAFQFAEQNQFFLKNTSIYMIK